MLDATGIPLFKLKANFNVPLLVMALVGFAGAVAGIFGTPAETYVTVDLVKKVVSFLFTMYNIQFFFFPVFLTKRNFGDDVQVDMYHVFTARVAGFLGGILVAAYWYMEASAAYTFISITVAGICLIGPVTGILFAGEGPDFPGGPIVMMINGGLIAAALL